MEKLQNVILNIQHTYIITNVKCNFNYSLLTNIHNTCNDMEFLIYNLYLYNFLMLGKKTVQLLHIIIATVIN